MGQVGRKRKNESWGVNTNTSTYLPNGKSVSTEKSIYNTLKDMIKTDTKVYYIMWKFCPEYINKGKDDKPIKTFQELKDRYACFSDKITEEVCERYLLEQGCQTAIKWVLKRLHQKKLIALYDAYYQKAIKGDTQAFKAFLDFSEKFFQEDKEGGLTKLLSKIPETELEENEEEYYSYTYEE